MDDQGSPTARGEREERPARKRGKPMPHATGSRGPEDRAGQPGEDGRRAKRSATNDKLRRAYHRVFPLSLRASLVLVVLIPTATAVGFAATTASGAWSRHSQAVSARNATLELDSLVRARAAIQDEYVPSAAIVYAAAYHVSPASLDTLLGIDFVAELATARRTVDQQVVLRSNALLNADFGSLMSLRVAETKGTASYAALSSLFVKFGEDVDSQWLSSVSLLSKQANA